MSTFSGLNTVTTALWAQRRGLDVTGQNIANVNTDGYSRQRVDLQSMGGTAVPAFFSTSRATAGGVSADDVIRIRDTFLESRAHTEYAKTARLTIESKAYEMVEQALREPGDTGIQSQLSDMWAAWGDVANHPTDPAARSQLLQRTETLVSGFQAARSSLDAQWTQAQENLVALVDEVNAVAGDIAKLNEAIRRATQDGKSANELADKRDVLVLKLADQVGATVRPAEDGVLNVLVGGVTLVTGAAATKLAVQGAVQPDDALTDMPRIVTVPGGTNVTPGGTAQGQITVLTDIVPTSRAALDEVAQKLVAQVNAVHKTGVDLAGALGLDLLGPLPAGTVTAATIRLNPAIGPEQIAASSLPNSTDAEIADRIANLGTLPGSPDSVYRDFIVALGVEAAVSFRNLGIQSEITTNVDAARESVAGVNLDEEMSNMLQFQHAYSAAARMVTAIDETLDVLINRTGLVGR
ncbi:flagellar hook-associated protein FlgK [Geodermatophilus ruber]|uniref:Flagellar hook-associated protein 1 n=1 Tax=Geodermatophilus ruber TaxID=504800 RepID=A0A1I4G2R7_9ACTN|nr:flagellar hook-associated protein FlgK [Geodermatophilus ruber]SFL23311.1 flagellar hook-associated protein 1 FlgK [Geodermatophilus ruber]